MEAPLDNKWTSRSAMIIPPAARTDIIEVTIDHEVLLVDPLSGQAHRLNTTATIVWHACRCRCTTLHIAEQLTQVYDVSLVTAYDAVEQTLTRLTNLGLLDVAPKQSA